MLDELNVLYDKIEAEGIPASAGTLLASRVSEPVLAVIQWLMDGKTEKQAIVDIKHILKEHDEYAANMTEEYLYREGGVNELGWTYLEDEGYQLALAVLEKTATS